MLSLADILIRFILLYLQELVWFLFRINCKNEAEQDSNVYEVLALNKTDGNTAG